MAHPPERGRRARPHLLVRSWTAAAAFARRTHGSAWRALVMPPGSRRQRLVRALMRQLMEAACRRRGRPLSDVRRQVARSRGAVLFQRPHHLARAFARRGHVAIFASIALDDEVFGFEEIEPNLFLFRGPQSELHGIPGPVLWTLPYNHHEARSFPRSATVVYDWIDDLAIFADFDAQLVRLYHERARREADIVTSVARTLHARVLAGRPDAVYLPNGVDEEHFTPAAPDPHDPVLARLRGEGKPIAGYYGALARWFDYELLEETARRRPDWNFVLIGPDYDGSLPRASLLGCSNVAWLGPRPYAILPAYLRAFDVATIPFRLDPITMATSPLKLYEYFAGGRPVVTTAMPECVAHPEVHVVHSAGEFASALDVARREGEDPAAGARLRAVGAANSWRERVLQLEDALAAGTTRRRVAS